jgi:hypothetical protein
VTAFRRRRCPVRRLPQTSTRAFRSRGGWPGVSSRCHCNLTCGSAMTPGRRHSRRFRHAGGLIVPGRGHALRTWSPKRFRPGGAARPRLGTPNRSSRLAILKARAVRAPRRKCSTWRPCRLTCWGDGFLALTDPLIEPTRIPQATPANGMRAQSVSKKGARNKPSPCRTAPVLRRSVAPLTFLGWPTLWCTSVSWCSPC